VKKIISAFDISAGTVRTSVAMYGYDVVLLNALTDISGDFFDSLIAAGEINRESIWGSSRQLKKDGVLQQINDASPVRGGRRIGHALTYVCDNVFQMKRQSSGVVSPQREVHKVLIILSNGESKDRIPSRLSCFSQSSQLNNDVTIIGLGMDENGVTSLQNPNVQSIFHLTGLSSLLLLYDDVMEKICSAEIQSCPGGNIDLVYLVDG